MVQALAPTVRVRGKLTGRTASCVRSRPSDLHLKHQRCVRRCVQGEAGVPRVRRESRLLPGELSPWAGGT
eukprot:11169953-Lingulodinium_polyedra.AAC.1